MRKKKYKQKRELFSRRSDVPTANTNFANIRYTRQNAANKLNGVTPTWIEKSDYVLRNLNYKCVLQCANLHKRNISINGTLGNIS